MCESRIIKLSWRGKRLKIWSKDPEWLVKVRIGLGKKSIYWINKCWCKIIKLKSPGKHWKRYINNTGIYRIKSGHKRIKVNWRRKPGLCKIMLSRCPGKKTLHPGKEWISDRKFKTGTGKCGERAGKKCVARGKLWWRSGKKQTGAGKLSVRSGKKWISFGKVSVRSGKKCARPGKLKSGSGKHGVRSGKFLLRSGKLYSLPGKKCARPGKNWKSE